MINFNSLLPFKNKPLLLIKMLLIQVFRTLNFIKERNSKEYYDTHTGKQFLITSTPVIVNGKLSKISHDEYNQISISEAWKIMRPAKTLLEVGCGELKN